MLIKTLIISASTTIALAQTPITPEWSNNPGASQHNIRHIHSSSPPPDFLAVTFGPPPLYAVLNHKYTVGQVTHGGQTYMYPHPTQETQYRTILFGHQTASHDQVNFFPASDTAQHNLQARVQSHPDYPPYLTFTGSIGNISRTFFGQSATAFISFTAPSITHSQAPPLGTATDLYYDYSYLPEALRIQLGFHGTGLYQSNSYAIASLEIYNGDPFSMQQSGSDPELLATLVDGLFFTTGDNEGDPYLLHIHDLLVNINSNTTALSNLFGQQLAAILGVGQLLQIISNTMTSGDPGSIPDGEEYGDDFTARMPQNDDNQYAYTLQTPDVLPDGGIDDQFSLSVDIGQWGLNSMPGFESVGMPVIDVNVDLSWATSIKFILHEITMLLLSVWGACRIWQETRVH